MEEILKIVNNYKCNIHSEYSLTEDHLKKQHPISGGWDLVSKLTSDKKDKEWDLDMLRRLSFLKGEKRWI